MRLCPDNRLPRWGLRYYPTGKQLLSLLLLSLVPLVGCSQLGGQEKPLTTEQDPRGMQSPGNGFHSEDLNNPADNSSEIAHVDSLSQADIAIIQKSPVVDIPLGPDGAPLLADLEDLQRTALSLAGQGSLGLARDHLFALQELVATPLPDSADSLYTAHLGSIRRRIWLLGGILAEQEAFLGDPQLSDSLLATGYGRLANLAFPDSLVPATGITLDRMTADLLKEDNQAVSRWLDYFTGPGRRNFQYWLDRKTALEPLVGPILTEAGLPRELIYLSMIESGLSPNAVSSVGAVGPWQFMPGTARAYRLLQNWWVDERRDPEMSTRAAAQHIQMLHDQFGDWALVLAAYNGGHGRLARKIRQHGHDNFWEMRLPTQTTAYVPKFIAAARIGENPEEYGFHRSQTEPLAYDVVPVNDATDLELIAECAQVPPVQVKRLNPALLRGASPPGVRDYPVRVPPGTGERARRALAKIPADRRLTWRQHRVNRGETLGEIARNYGTTVGDLAKLNKLKDVHLIRPGDQLLIPMPAELAAQARKRAGEKGHYVPPEGYRRVSYKVKSGDTLGKIASKLGVTVKHLRKVNGIYKSHLIYPGQKIYAYRPGQG